MLLISQFQVSDAMGHSLTCIRSMTSEILKNGKAKFKTMDSAVISGDSKKDRDEGGRRVVEVNAEMAQAMGVSKAILNNVIFCHQEDSNWPLDEGKKVKEKFDAIFDTTEYNKAIDTYNKFRKQYQERLKLCIQEKIYLEVTKRDADRKQLELDMLQEKHDKMSSRVEELDVLLSPLDEKMEKLLEKEQQFGKLYGENVTIESKINFCITNAENIRQKIRNFLDCSLDELKDQLETFSETQRLNDEKLSVFKKEYQSILDKEKQLNESVVRAKSKSSLLSGHSSQMQELVSERSKAIKSLSQDLNIHVDLEMMSQDMTGDELSSTLLRIHRSIAEKSEALRVIKTQDEKKDQELQVQIDKFRSEKTASETNLIAHKNHTTKLNGDQKKIRDEIALIETSMPTFNQLLTKIEQQQAALEKYKSENNVKDLQDQRDSIEIDKIELEEKLPKIEADVELLESISKLSGELDMKQNDLTKDQRDFERCKNKNTSALKLLFPTKTVDRNYRNVVETFNGELKQEVQDIKTSCDDARIKGNRLKTERDHLHKQHKKKELELKETNEKIYEICDGLNYIEVLTSQKEKVEKLTMDLAFHRSSENTFKHYVTKIEEEPCCPLCHKDLNSNEGSELKNEIGDKIRQLPTLIEKTETKRKAELKKLDELNEVKSSFDQIGNFEKELKKMFDDMKELEVKYQENQAFVQEKEIQVAEPEFKLKTMTPAFFNDMFRMDELIKSISVKTMEIDKLKTQLPNEMPKKSLDEAKAELRQLNSELRSKNDLMNKLSQKIHKTQTGFNDLQDKINTLISKKMENQQKVQGLDRMKLQLKEIEKENLKLEEKFKEEEQKLVPIIEALEALIAKKQKAKLKSSETAELADKALNDLKLSVSSIERLNKDIESYENMKLEEKIAKTMKDISKWNEQIKQIQHEIKLKSDEIKRLTDAVNNQEKHQRNLEDNIELHNIETEKAQAEENLAKLRKEIGVMNPKKLKAEKNDLIVERDKINEERQHLRGSLLQSEDRIKSATNEANEPKYRKAHANFNRVICKESGFKLIIDDLLKYRSALEHSLLKFHSDKMLEINERIRELWSNIYRGNDIDYILIKTDEEDVKTVSDKRRSYSYRVVQAKSGGAEIDMRGRCSAGQKVLASLIIRMALADTFSVNCGILALDEPTTNLDQNNIQSLCEALSQIVDEREKSGKFMLIIITHDEKFVTSMERAEEYHKLSRDHKGRSRIEKLQNH